MENGNLIEFGEANVLTQSFEIGDVHLSIKRIDLIHPEISGNKWYKLKYNLVKALESDHKTLLTFGGPWSNHIHATAAAGKIYGIKTIGIIRGEDYDKPTALMTDTLRFAKECGMQLEFISRSAYAEKETEDFKGWLHDQYGIFHLVPEGGSNFLGVNGCMEILSDYDKKNFDIICCACGTGATLAGILISMQENQRAIGFPALKGGDFLKEEVIKHIGYYFMDEALAAEYGDRMEMESRFHFGGYGKWNDELLEFISEFEAEYQVPLDQIYTGKMMFGLLEKIRAGEFEKGTRILAIHTGGLQGKNSLISAS